MRKYGFLASYLDKPLKGYVTAENKKEAVIK